MPKHQFDISVQPQYLPDHSRVSANHGSYFCISKGGTPFSSEVALFLCEAQGSYLSEQPLRPRVLH